MVLKEFALFTVIFVALIGSSSLADESTADNETQNNGIFDKFPFFPLKLSRHFSSSENVTAVEVDSEDIEAAETRFFCKFFFGESICNSYCKLRGYSSGYCDSQKTCVCQ